MHHPAFRGAGEAVPAYLPGRPPLPATLGRRLRTGVPCINIGLVNNMPDGALQNTERQFRNLAAEAGVPVRFFLFAIPGIARSERTSHYLQRHYATIDDLRRSRMDALIVTGAEPRAADLTEEPFWPALTEVLDWAEANTVSTMVSCLAAHAAVRHFDGIRTQKLQRKCSGVFSHHKVSDHPLTKGIAAPWRAVHSRRNGLSEAALLARGYTILGKSGQAGVHLFTRQRQSLLIGLQGHPEYERETLLHEYKRDIGRFLRREQDFYPTMPFEYFSQHTERLLSEFQAAALARRDPETMTLFPNDAAAGSPMNTWLPAARCVFRNWLHSINARKSQWSSLSSVIQIQA